MNIQQLPSSSSLLSVKKPVESPPVIPPAIINHQMQTTSSITNMPSRSSNKSFSNRLGMMIPPNQTQNSIVQESKPVPTAHQYTPQKPKSPVVVKQPVISPIIKNQIEPRSKEILSPRTPKCKFFFN